ncbi:CBS domain-containing protein [Novipirellula artificiosorum]|uniref:CBS domain protein n=1 Tax=Novipirellula artificiosorum TaxID=2528016 RepID=A0A5C6DU85_9BACT|nr:CBS domain-containing protein [Novipirellula artificiosorum]TWU38339.1 CBS domain protein [Novipirellula artificiosorum]
MKPQPAPNANELMTAVPHTVTPEMRLADVIAFLVRHDLASVLVARNENSKKELLGFISEGDCLEHLSNELFYGAPMPIQTAATIMKRHPLCVTTDTDIFALSSIFVSHNYHYLPVIDGKFLVGMVCRSDVLRLLDEYYRRWVKLREDERTSIDVHEIMNHRFLVKS